MSAMASQITSLTVVYSIVYSGADQRKHQSSASLAFVRGIHRGRWIPAQKTSNAENVSIWWRHHDCIYCACHSSTAVVLCAKIHYNGVIMSSMASQITNLNIVYSTVYSRRRSKKTPKLRGPVNSLHKGPTTWKLFPFGDVNMYCESLDVIWKKTTKTFPSNCNCNWNIVSETGPRSVFYKFVLAICLSHGKCCIFRVHKDFSRKRRRRYISSQGLYLQKRCRLAGIGIALINLRRSNNRLKFIKGIPIQVRRCLLSEQRPWPYVCYKDLC